MKSLIPPRPCLLGCGYPVDGVEHYVCCKVYWDFIVRRRPSGLGLRLDRGRDVAMLVAPTLCEEDVARLAIGLYSLHRTVNAIRFACDRSDVNPMVLLRMFAKRAVDNHSCKRLLRWSP